MAARGWGGSVATAIGVAAGAGAAQLGVGYGLGVIAWPTEAGGAGASAWVASLAWVAWIASTSAVAGAICADRLRPGAVSTLEGRRGARGAVTTSIWRVALAVAAAIGALITVPLVAVPARVVAHPDTSSPETIAGGYAVVGVVLGLIVAIAAVASRSISVNVVASTSWLWLLAIVAVIDGVAAGRGLGTAQLAVWQFTASGPVVRNVHVGQALLTLGAALVIGALAALPGARRGDSAVGVAVSGAIGPLLVAAAYFLAAPQLDEIPARELSPYLVIPYGVIAGLAGSVTVAGLGHRLERRSRITVPATRTGDAPSGAQPLADEAYASPGGYGTDGSTDPVARGSASVESRDPVWPEEPATAATTSTVTRGRRGKSG